jgi:glycosyltransferase involved in cell wall biosynthesis
MRITLIVTLFPPKWLAGTEIASYNIAKFLGKRGHEVHVITSLDNPFPKNETLENFCIHRITFKKVRVIGVILFWFQILYKIKKINPDIVHIQALTISLPGLVSKIFLKKPYIVWARGSDVYLPDKFTKLISKVVLKNASYIIALNEDMKRKINTIYKRENIIVVPNGIELEKFKDIYPQKQDNKIKTIIFVGTLRPVKGVEYLIKAMSIIHEKLPDTNLLIVGDGPDREKLETLAQELDLQGCTCFAGNVSNEKIPEYMAKADLFVLPSLSEGFPLVILEAMASGLPIVTTNIGGLPDIVKNGENGFLVEPKNPEALADKIMLLLSNKKSCKKISIINKTTIRDYSWSKIAEKLEKVYKEIYLND